jgi:hypothetical protein
MLTSTTLTDPALVQAQTPTLVGAGGATAEVVGTVALIGLMIGVGVLYNRWAYDDWTCMFKNCMQTSTKRRRR